jgi:uncharacterized protein (TIGR02246 family)
VNIHAQDDEEQIRALVSTWMAATKAGDAKTVLDLMTDDVIFLVPGKAPMGKAEFAAAAKAQTGHEAPRLEGTADIQEITVAGDWAFMLTKLTVVAIPADGSPSVERAGHTLTVLRRGEGRWLLFRDANLLAPAQPSAA